MKKLLILLMVLVSLEAKTEIIKKVKVDRYMTVMHICIDGYLYYATRYSNGGVSMVQATEVEYGGTIGIMVCNRK